ncbi:Alpha/Beta hydrolase protein [Penicillium concentricum]|uniref:Alpha/Beta hydrolase protein n=1 Tax=Penicillium concentricum TaxID=293559 RepID=A0A9W9VLY2_9EURO|nr:Alpha/Beta hydrolase protein [Penicillium concentricum]KAJ5385556.1 Alpha/Beta hydrolase protein [Penicillium concentricum]
MPQLHLSNGQTDYYEINDFTAPWKADETDIVIFQAGIGRHTELLFHLVPLLSGSVRLIRRDLRGHGKSSIGDADGYNYTLDTLVEEMAEFVDKVAKRPVHWVGESTAGMLAIAFAKAYPEKLKSLIIISTPLELGERFMSMTSEPYSSPGEAVRKLGILEWKRTRPVTTLDANQNVESYDMGDFSGEAYKAWDEEMLQKCSSEGIARYFDFITQVDITGLPQDVKTPTLVLSPKNSMASPVAVNQQIASTIQDSRLVIIPSVGHMVYIDQPRATCDAILQWVQDLKQRRSV